MTGQVSGDTPFATTRIENAGSGRAMPLDGTFHSRFNRDPIVLTMPVAHHREVSFIGFECRDGGTLGLLQTLLFRH